MEKKIYLCIDLKSFYASCECVERGLDSLHTNLVVADPSRGPGAICLAVSPSLKELGVRNRCRLFEIPRNINYITAIPRMSLYINYSAKIYGIYLKYVAKEDIFVYSIDECFLDITSYLKLYNKTPLKLAKIIIDDVYNQTKICATAGIGTNLFLCKVALDITAKHVDNHMGYLDIDKFKKEIWHHRPITDIWQIGHGIAARLAKMGIYDLYDVSHTNPDLLYKEFGVNAEYLIDHSNGIEPTTIKEIKEYKPEGKSISTNQILFEDYNANDALIVIKEMVDTLVRDLVGKHLACSVISLGIGYSKDVTKATAVSLKLDEVTNSFSKIVKYYEMLYKKNVKANYPIRSLAIGFGGIVDEDYKTFNLFDNPIQDKKEEALQHTMLDIQQKYGKNAILKGMNMQRKATQRKRNTLIGGHNAE